MRKGILKAILRVLAGTLFILVLAATIGIPAGTRGPAAAPPDDEPAMADPYESRVYSLPLRTTRLTAGRCVAASRQRSALARSSN